MIPSPKTPPVDARVALAVTLAATAVVVLIPRGCWIDFGLFASALVVGAIALRIDLRLALQRMLPALPVLLLIALTVPISVPGEPLWEPGWAFQVTREGVALAGTTLCKVALAAALLACLTSAFTTAQMLAALRGLGCPSLPIMILSTMQRQLQIIGAEWRRLRRAAQARAPQAHRLARAPRVMGRLAAMLLVRSLDRSERVHRAMAARGHDGAAALPAPARLTAHDWLALAFGLCAVAALRILGMLLG